MPLKTSDIKEQSSEQLLKPDASNSDDRIQCSERNSDFLLDPLRWFGILVPPTLRDCQSSFKSAATDDIPRLASLVKDMKELEIEIRRARKKLRKARWVDFKGAFRAFILIDHLVKQSSIHNSPGPIWSEGAHTLLRRQLPCASLSGFLGTNFYTQPRPAPAF